MLGGVGREVGGVGGGVRGCRGVEPDRGHLWKGQATKVGQRSGRATDTSRSMRDRATW
jgi:hypothetical protein